MILAYETTQEWNPDPSTNCMGFATNFNVLEQVFHSRIDGKMCEDTREEVEKEQNIQPFFKHLFQAPLQLHPCSLASIQ